MRTVSRLVKGLKGRTGRQLLKLVVYSVVCLAVLAGLVARIGNVNFFADRVSYKAAMPDITGLVVTDEVKVAGVGVGKVTGISVKHGNAVVSFSVDRKVQLRSDTRVGVRWRNILGQKYLYLYPGTTGAVLHRGAELPVTQAVQSADVGAFLNAIGPILQAIDPAKANAFIEAFNTALDNNETKVQGLLSDSAAIASKLGGDDQQVGSLIGNLDTVVTGLAQRDGDLQTVITRFRSLAGSLAVNNDSLQLLVERFAAVQSRLDDLVTGSKANLDETISNLVTIAKVLSEHRDDLSRSLATLPAGLRVYDQISSYGQWFQIRTRITCLANQTQCSAEVGGGQPGSGPTPTVGSVLNFALTGGGGA